MRCFIAAWPDEPTRLALSSVSDDVRRRVKHRRASRFEDLHLTLAFIGDIAADVAFDLSAAIKKLRFKPFAWRPDTLGFFRDAGVVWIGTVDEPAKPLATLLDRVRALLDDKGVLYDKRPLAPHITLLRGVDRFVAEKVPPIHWRIESIALYRSDPARRVSSYVRVDG
jgi:2'-5' RNA ligase